MVRRLFGHPSFTFFIHSLSNVSFCPHLFSPVNGHTDVCMYSASGPESSWFYSQNIDLLLSRARIGDSTLHPLSFIHEKAGRVFCPIIPYAVLRYRFPGTQLDGFFLCGQVSINSEIKLLLESLSKFLPTAEKISSIAESSTDLSDPGTRISSTDVVHFSKNGRVSLFPTLFLCSNAT